MAITWQRWYPSKSTAIINYVGYTICAILGALILAHAAYTLIFRAENNGKKKTKTLPQHNDKWTMNIITASTMGLILIAWIYPLGQSIIRLRQLFLNQSVRCTSFLALVSCVAFSRVCLYVVFVFRLKTTFQGTSYEYSKWVLILVGGGGSCLTLVTGLYYMSQTIKAHIPHWNEYHNCVDVEFNYLPAIAPSIGCDFVVSISLLVLFIRKLVALVRDAQEISAKESVFDVRAADRIKTLVRLISKLTVLNGIATISGWLLFVAIGPIYPGISLAVDGVISMLCCLFCYGSYNTPYTKLCGCCRVCCFSMWYNLLIDNCWGLCGDKYEAANTVRLKRIFSQHNFDKEIETTTTGTNTTTGIPPSTASTETKMASSIDVNTARVNSLSSAPDSMDVIVTPPKADFEQL